MTSPRVSSMETSLTTVLERYFLLSFEALSIFTRARSYAFGLDFRSFKIDCYQGVTADFGCIIALTLPPGLFCEPSVCPLPLTVNVSVAAS